MGLVGISEERRRIWLEDVAQHLEPGETVDEVALLALPEGFSPGAASNALPAGLGGAQPGTSVPRFAAAIATDRAAS